MIDLHAHTTASDGRMAPRDLVRAAARAGVTVLAVTDHDTADGLDEALAEGPAAGVRVLPGVELSTHAGGMDVHILGYFIDPREPALTGLCAALRRSRVERIRRMVGALQAAGVRVTEEEVFAEAGPGTVSRAHVARVLVRRGIVPTFARAFERYLGRNARAYVPSSALTPAEAVLRIRGAGGVPVLAHPGDLADDGIIPALVQDGIEGLEAFSHNARPSEVERYVRIARDFRLLVTGGSDFHGETDFGRSLGETDCPAEYFRELEAWHARRAEGTA
jgi:predicted metal-dependent phosphoesterase TrpH